MESLQDTPYAWTIGKTNAPKTVYLLKSKTSWFKCYSSNNTIVETNYPNNSFTYEDRADAELALSTDSRLERFEIIPVLYFVAITEEHSYHFPSVKIKVDQSVLDSISQTVGSTKGHPIITTIPKGETFLGQALKETD